MLYWEIKKMLNRFTIYFITSMLLLNCIITFISQSSSLSPQEQLIQSEKSKLFYTYTHDRNSFDNDYQSYLLQLEAYSTWLENLAYSDSVEDFTWINQKIDFEDYGDQELFSEVITQIDKCSNFHNTIDLVLSNAYRELNSMGMKKGDFSYEYLINVVLQYKKFENLALPVEYVLGWNEFFSSNVSLILLTFTIIGVCGQSFLLEKRANTLIILHTTKYGHAKLRIVKISCILFFSIILNFLFTSSSLLIFYFTTGLSSPTVPIQVLDDFLYCPLMCNIWEYLILITLWRLLFIFIIGSLVALIGQISGNEIVTFGSLTSYCLTNVLITTNVSHHFTEIKQYTLWSILNGTYFFNKYRAINVFNYCIPLNYGIIVLSILIAIVFCVIILTTKISLGIQKTNNKKLRSAYILHPPVDFPNPTQAYSLLYFEFHKLTRKKASIFLLLFLFTARCYLSEYYFIPEKSIDATVWRSYISDIYNLGGTVTSETDFYIDTEHEYIRSASSSYNIALENYKNGTLSLSELHDAASIYNYANSVSGAFQKLLSRNSYLKQQSEQFSNLYYVDEEGIIKYVTPQLDILSLVFIIILLTEVFSTEYHYNFCPILHICKNGRKKTFLNKMLFSFLCISSYYLFISLIDNYYFSLNYHLQEWTANIMSIPELQESLLDISILCYLILYKVLGYIGLLFLSGIILSISVLMGNLYKASVLTMIVTIIPYILSSFGVQAFDVISVKYLLHPPIHQKCIYTFLIYFTVSLILHIIAWNKWNSYCKV